MKVYSISKWAFYAICLLILILPISRHWRLLAGGKNAIGEAGPYERYMVERFIGGKEAVYASTIEFQYEGQVYTTRGPANYEYRQGRRIILRVDPGNPADHCILTFSGLYLNNYSILPLFLLTVWAAFYLSFNNYRKKRRPTATSTPASSPYQPFGRGKGTRSGRPQVPGSFPRISRKDL